MKRLLLLLLLLLGACVQMHARQGYWDYEDNHYAESYFQYLPAVGAVGLAFLGPEARDGLGSRIWMLGLGALTEVAVVRGLKHYVDEERPDGSALNSFPSGHTATAFMGAELLRHEYGWAWGAGAYAVAGAVAACRVNHRRHYWWDTVAGAGVGILSAQVGIALNGLRLRWLGRDASLALVPVADPVLKCYGARFNCVF